MKHLFSILICISIFISFSSCNDKYERSIHKHFKKFILTGEYNNFKISSIRRKIGDTITKTKKEKAIIIQKIIKLQENNKNIKYYIEKKEHEINVIKKGNYVNLYGSKVFDLGYKTHIGNIVSYNSDNVYFDSNNEGKENLLVRNNSELQNLKRDINVNNKTIINKFEEMKIIERNENNTVLEIRTSVYIKGYVASGQKIIKYRVRQNPDGEVLLVTKF